MMGRVEPRNLAKFFEVLSDLILIQICSALQEKPLRVAIIAIALGKPRIMQQLQTCAQNKQLARCFPAAAGPASQVSTENDSISGCGLFDFGLLSPLTAPAAAPSPNKHTSRRTTSTAFKSQVEPLY